MTRNPKRPRLTFTVQPETAPGEVLEDLAALMPSRLLAAADRERTYFDTFDWRLYRGGFELAQTRAGTHGELRVEPRDGGPPRSARSRGPGFAWDLPEGWLRELVVPLARMRRLLPRLVLRTRATTLEAIDAEAKVVARVVLEEGKACLPEGEAWPVQTTLRVEPLRGYEPCAAEVARQLAALPGVVPLKGSTLEVGLRAVGWWPGDDPSSPASDLHPRMRADQATRAVLRRYLGVIEANEDGVLRDLDSEFLHDFRVATRRSRSIVGQMGDLLDPESVAAGADGLAWLGSVTGPLRDLDVFLLRFREEELDPALGPLQQHLSRTRQRERRRLLRALRSPRYTELKRSWLRELDTDTQRADPPADASRAIRTVARERIARRFERVLRRGAKIDAGTPARKVHRLRIQCKKLRYLIDAFGPLFEPEGTRALLKRLKRLQDTLGTFNDYEVQIELLEHLAGEMKGDTPESARALLAMGRWQERMRADMVVERERFARRFARFAADKGVDALVPREDDVGA
ncbi:MAG: CHAD domain-containing protein [Planctomycetota bacterium]